MSRRPPADERTGTILREWAAGKFASEIAAEMGLTEDVVAGLIGRSAGPEAAKARLEHYRNRMFAKYRGRESMDREARVLRDWADGWSCTDIAARQSDIATRNMAMGIVDRSRGEAAERAKRAHAAAAALRYPKGAPRVKRAPPEPAQQERVVSLDALVAGLTPQRFLSTRALTEELKQQRRAERKTKAARAYLVKEPLSPRELAERRAKSAAAGRAAIARVELRLIDNPAFVARAEKPADVYGHMRSERGYRDAMAALTRDRKTGEIFHGQ